MTIAHTYEERMALIAKLAPKYNRRAKTYRVVKAAVAKAAARPKTTEAAKEKENIYHYTDASKYAKEYYGETMYETTRHDNDWG